MNIPVFEPTVMYEDNQSCISLISGNGGKRTKHIDVCYHQIQDLRDKKIVDVKYCSSQEMLADVFTKPLARDFFERFVKRLELLKLKLLKFILLQREGVKK